VEEGKSLGIDGTPAFLIGITTTDGQKVHVSKVLLGAESYETFKEAIDGLLAAPKK
jgi:predicted DsbA family dithiol-disulfide isomerase